MNNKDLKGRKVQVIHKMNALTQTEMRVSGTLAVGKTFRFNSGDAYKVQGDGSLRNVSNRRIKGKAAKRAAKRQHVAELKEDSK